MLCRSPGRGSGKPSPCPSLPPTPPISANDRCWCSITTHQPSRDPRSGRRHGQNDFTNVCFSFIVSLAGNHHGSRKFSTSLSKRRPRSRARLPVSMGHQASSFHGPGFYTESDPTRLTDLTLRPLDSTLVLTNFTDRLSIHRWCLLPRHPLSHRLPLQAPQGQLHHSHLPPQHQQQRQHLPRHPA